MRILAAGLKGSIFRAVIPVRSAAGARGPVITHRALREAEHEFSRRMIGQAVKSSFILFTIAR